MNHTRLKQDFMADAIAHAARKRRRRRQATLASLPLALIPIFAVQLKNHSPTPQPVLIHTNDDPSPVTAPETSAPLVEDNVSEKSSNDHLAYQNSVIQSEEELLELLKDFGPVISQNEHGEKFLTLTSQSYEGL